MEIRKNKLFNVDTEGAGTEVLMGAEKILKNIESISADLESGSKDWSKNTIPEAINYVLSKNFELVVAIALSNSGTFLFKNMVSYKNWLLFGNFIFWAKYIL